MPRPTTPTNPPRDAKSIRIRILYFDGCPNIEKTLELIHRVAGPRVSGTDIETVRVSSPQEAAQLRFLGSPTVLVNGVDIDPSARARTDFAMVCRLYGASGIPTAEMISAAICESVE